MQGCTFVANSFVDYAVNRSKVVFLLVEAIGESFAFLQNSRYLYPIVVDCNRSAAMLWLCYTETTNII